MNASSEHNDHTIIIGASHSGVACAEALRHRGYQGEITIIDRLKGTPFERPPLSKKFLTAGSQDDDQRFYLRSTEWYQQNDIKLISGRETVSIDSKLRRLTLDDGQMMDWRNLVLATGATPRKLPSFSEDGSDDIFYLRDVDDARLLRDGLGQAQSVAIIGGGYIGLEVAASAASMGAKVMVIEAAPRLLARVASVPASQFFTALHKDKGVIIHTDAVIKKISHDNGQTRLDLASSEALCVDMVVAGIGVVPDIALCAMTGVKTNNGVSVDNSYRTNINGIFAIGDVALPQDGYTAGALRIESVHHAQMSASIAAAAITGEPISNHEIPWFWSEQFDCRLQSAGIVPADRQTVTRQGRREGAISFWSFEGDKFRAVEAINDAQAYMVGKKLLESDSNVSLEVVADTTRELKSLLPPAQKSP